MGENKITTTKKQTNKGERKEEQKAERREGIHASKKEGNKKERKKIHRGYPYMLNGVEDQGCQGTLCKD